MIKITGLNQLNRQIDDAKKALKALDGKLTTVSFDPTSPESIEAAIQQVNTIIDEKIGEYASNSIIGPLAQQMKEKYREAIVEKAAAERLKGDEANE